MWLEQTLLCLQLTMVHHCIDAFVYSCEEVTTTLMNSNFEQYSKYAFVATEDDFPHSRLERLHLQLGDTSYSFASLSKNTITVTNDGSLPWTIAGDNNFQYDCGQEFTLILRSDEAVLTVIQSNSPPIATFSSTAIFISPEVGFWIKKLNAVGDGTVTIYTGAGSGEEEERYLLRSFPCDSLPDWIATFENVITIESKGCDFYKSLSSDMSEDDNIITVYQHKQALVLISGRSNNLQNLQGKRLVAFMNVGDDGLIGTTVNMELSFDSANSGSVGLNKDSTGAFTPYFNGSHAMQFATDFLAIQWLPTALQPWEVSRNHDNIYIEINISPGNAEYLCPDDFTLESSEDSQNWCYLVVYGTTASNEPYSFNDAIDGCAKSDGTLPIVTSAEVNSKLSKFAHTDEISFVDVLLGILCDKVECKSGEWVWQNGDPLSFEAFKGTPLGTACSTSNHFSLDSEGYWIESSADETVDKYICAVRAFANPDFVPSTTTHRTDQNDLDNVFPIWAIILIVVFVIVLCAGFIGVIIFSRRRVALMNARVLEDQLKRERIIHYELSHQDDIDSEWEIERGFVDVDFSHKLGEGAFGSVFLGHVFAKNIPSLAGRSIAEHSALTNHTDSVAVKILHESADIGAMNEFRAEIKIMKKIGYHERLVNMLACVTRNAPILLICEYCSNGDLLGFMQERRQFMLDNPENLVDAKVITCKKQLMFAIQIVYGLEYLSSQGFIHRDIAARNILVDHQETCKIGDFGLGRTLGEDDQIYQAIGRKLPLKWMSPEAIDKYYFSTAADVWSFGILLFEIVTLGGIPYAGWPTAEILPRLKRGERLDKPDNCSNELYEVMSACWSEKPSDRPSFDLLRSQLGHLLEEVDEDLYLKLDSRAHYYVPESNSSDD